ncbi:MAG: hypothetical protein N2572_05150 [Syntrophales bacterium]|nr:hypothetical protein [Syntrophales bacterium]
MDGYVFVNILLFIFGCVILTMLKRKYRGIKKWELIVVVFLYAVLVLLFTSDIVSVVKTFVEEILL